MIDEAERVLIDASRARRPGRFQLEAAIQSVHARHAVTGHTDWEAIALLYEGLVRVAPTIGARVAQAGALAEARSAGAGLDALDAISASAKMGRCGSSSRARHRPDRARFRAT